MGKKRKHRLFNLIAPIYGLFYNKQKKHYQKIIKMMEDEFDVSAYQTVLDVGCGTGALCSALEGKGLNVTGVDPAYKMLKVARKKTKSSAITFVQADSTKGLPFEDDSFDLVIASYVAHGLQIEERRKLYKEMSRIAKEKVIIHDYNENRAPLTTFVEFMEGGDYFQFIQYPTEEMENCETDMIRCFENVREVEVDIRASWYICSPFKDK
jgi:ubiquinone/menaquinone biosynthesis C-methylase UbiE